MILTKTINVKKSSRNKLTKKQLTMLRAHKYIIFERSWENILFRLKYIKARALTNKELHKYTLIRVENLFDLIEKELPKEVAFTLGYNETDYNKWKLIGDRKARNCKVSIVK